MAKGGIYTIKKYDGDDRYSWAVFKKADLKGASNPVLYGEATPVDSGLDRSVAQSVRDQLNRKDEK